MAKAIMIQGTMSNAGKSLLTAGLCRIFKQDGYRVAPFKSQNMALNSFVTAEGLEMGRAQVMQAEAAGVAPSVRMNPILLKPNGDMASQVVVHGEVVDNMAAVDYFRYRKTLIPAIMEAFNSLSAEYDIIVIEGAGSPAEINLRENDVVNMGMAKMANAPVLLVGDIDRGGVFASLYGTVALLEEDERQRIKALIINKFRGDLEILRPGLGMLEELTGLPVAGVVPYVELDIDDEDTLAPRLTQQVAVKAVDIAVIRLPHLSNFTDFNPLERFDFVSVRYVGSVQELGTPDLVILPGTKNTMNDLRWLRQNGLEPRICRMAAEGTPVIGICGGYQMLGRQLSDPQGVEGGGTLRGMGLLDVETVFQQQKTRTQVTAVVLPQRGYFEALTGCTMAGYEIHMGSTEGAGRGTESPFATFTQDGEAPRMDGAVCGHVWGSYLHGLFDQGTLAQRLVELLAEKKGVSHDAESMLTLAEYKETQYDKLAACLRQSLDMELIYRVLHEGVE